MSKIITLGIAFILLSLQVVMAQADDSSVGQLESLLESNRNLEGEFKQVTLDERGQQLQVSQGIFILSKPNQFVWDSVTPFAQRIVSDGSVITVWDVDLEQATRKPLSGSVGSSPAALLGQPADQVLPHYSVTQLDKGQYRLVPKSDEGLFQSLILLFDEGVISGITILDTLGQKTLIEFNNVQVHKGVAKENFILDLPDYVDVFEENS